MDTIQLFSITSRKGSFEIKNIIKLSSKETLEGNIQIENLFIN